MDAFVVARILLFATTVQITAMSAVRAAGVPTYDLCSVSGPLHLAGNGYESAANLQLRPPARSQDSDDVPVAPCRVEIAAPETHLLSLLLVPAGTAQQPNARRDAAEDGNDVTDVRQFDEDSASCDLTVALPCTDAVAWTANLCSTQSAEQALHFTELFPRNVTLLWYPPPVGSRRKQQAAGVIVTAVGKGERLCSGEKFHRCWRRPRFAALCVANELRCDGHRNCPMDGNDEEVRNCGGAVAQWLRALGSQLVGVGPGSDPGHRHEFENADNDSDDRGNLNGARILELLKHSGFTTTKGHSNRTRHHQDTHPAEGEPERAADTLSNYGPWGYLMLGMLVCGAVLMLCGLWECCCRQPKPTPSTTSHAQPGVLPVLILNQPQSVLSQDSDMEEDPPRPPAYDDLDQPPSYGALFPVQPKDDPVSPPMPFMDAETNDVQEIARLDPNSRTQNGAPS